MDVMRGDLHGKFGKLYGELDKEEDGLDFVLEYVQEILIR